jgi:hypothetical protein
MSALLSLMAGGSATGAPRHRRGRPRGERPTSVVTGVLPKRVGPSPRLTRSWSLCDRNKTKRCNRSSSPNIRLDVDESAQDPTDHLERALQTPLSARPTDPVADQLGQTEPHRCAFVEGFSLHANVAVQAHDREGLLPVPLRRPPGLQPEAALGAT